MTVINVSCGHKTAEEEEEEGGKWFIKNAAYLQVAWLPAKCRLLFAKHLSKRADRETKKNKLAKSAPKVNKVNGDQQTERERGRKRETGREREGGGRQTLSPSSKLVKCLGTAFNCFCGTTLTKAVQQECGKETAAERQESERERESELVCC